MQYFTQEQVEALTQGCQEVLAMPEVLCMDLVTRQYRTAEAKEHATHGLARRVETLGRCIENVFEILPPDQADVPDRDVVVDATIHIQAFVFNVFGCCDNIAWMWVLENNLRGKDGKPLDRKYVGIGPGSKEVRESCPQQLREYLESRDPWFRHLKDFRDALAHRIPLYIPPYTVSTEQIDEYQQLEAAKNEALKKGDLTSHERIEAHQQRLERFEPIMTHSWSEAGSRRVVVHAQLLADFRTVGEIARKVLGELNGLHWATPAP